MKDKELKFELIDITCGDLFTLEEFEQSCECNALTDYDGYGNLATKDLVSNKIINPTDLFTFGGNEDIKQLKLQGFTHVLWYNR